MCVLICTFWFVLDYKVACTPLMHQYQLNEHHKFCTPKGLYPRHTGRTLKGALTLKSHITSSTFLYCCTIGVLVRNDGVIRPTVTYHAKAIGKNYHEGHSGPQHGGQTKGKLVGYLVAVETFRNVVWRI